MKIKHITLLFLFTALVSIWQTASAQTVTYDTSKRYIVSLNDGTKLKGKILSQDATKLDFQDDNLGLIPLQRSSVKSVEPEFGTDIYIFKLKDGTIITGTIVGQTATNIKVETKNIGVVTLDRSKIESQILFSENTITDKGQVRFKNPNATRYLFAPTAYMLKKGEGYYQNFYGAGNAVNFGITNHISIGGGVVGFWGAYITPKIGTEIAKNVNISAGLLLGNSLIPLGGDQLGFGIGYGLLTFGNTDHNLTFGSGYGFTHTNGSANQQKRPIFVINGMTRLGTKYALVSENWVVPTSSREYNTTTGQTETKNNYTTFFSYAFRWMKENKTVDFGFINTPELMQTGWLLGIPYVDFIIRFGNYKD